MVRNYLTTPHPFSGIIFKNFQVWPPHLRNGKLHHKKKIIGPIAVFPGQTFSWFLSPLCWTLVNSLTKAQHAYTIRVMAFCKHLDTRLETSSFPSLYKASRLQNTNCVYQSLWQLKLQFLVWLKHPGAPQPTWMKTLRNTQPFWHHGRAQHWLTPNASLYEVSRLQDPPCFTNLCGNWKSSVGQVSWSPLIYLDETLSDTQSFSHHVRAQHWHTPNASPYEASKPQDQNICQFPLDDTSTVEPPPPNLPGL